MSTAVDYDLPPWIPPGGQMAAAHARNLAKAAAAADTGGAGDTAAPDPALPEPDPALPEPEIADPVAPEYEPGDPEADESAANQRTIDHWTTWHTPLRLTDAVALDRITPLVVLHRLRGTKQDGTGLHMDICQKVSVLEARLGAGRRTIAEWFNPLVKEPNALSAIIRLRLRTEDEGQPAFRQRVDVPAALAHQWRGGDDGALYWRFDVEPDIERGDDGSLAVKSDRYLPVRWWWLYRDPAETAGDTWVLRADHRTLDSAIKGAAFVHRYSGKTGHCYKGPSEGAKELGVDERTVKRWLAAAEDLEMIGVNHSVGGAGHTSIRWVRHHPNAKTSNGRRLGPGETRDRRAA